jgi:hypothetical protein
MLALLAIAAYVFTPVTVPNATIFDSFGPNDQGQVVLVTSIGSGIWENGNFTLLPPPPKGVTQVIAFGINSAGTVVGAVGFSDGHEEGFILIGSTYKIFARPGWANTEPRFIASSELVTGWSFPNDSGPSAGFVYDPATDTFTDATPAGSVSTIVQGMNKFGVISGNGVDPTLGEYGVIWQLGEFAQGKRTVPFLERFTVANEAGRARGINDAGLVVGYLSSGKAGFVGNPLLGFRLLHVPGSTGGSKTVCEGINNLGQVTCASYTADFLEQVFLGTPQP